MFAASAFSAGCASTLDHECTAGEEAAVMEHRRCGPDIDEALIAPVLSGAAVDGWEPAYVSAPHGGSYYRRLAGAVFTVHATSGYNGELLDRALECHSARRVLGRIPSADDARDPFWLPGKTVDIDVASTGKDFLVSVRSQDVAAAHEILARAQAFAEKPAQP